MITHHRPVFAALYFVLVVLSSAGLFLMLEAEFMAFALIIVYAGAILITYVFVIMLAQQAPVPGEEARQAEYDVIPREPAAAVVRPSEPARGRGSVWRSRRARATPGAACSA